MRLHSVSQGRLLCWDLESRPLAFWFDGRTTAEITAFGWKWSDEDDVHSLVLLNNGRFMRDDGKKITARRAYETFAAEMRSAAVVYGHNIRTFDLPLLNAGLLRLHMPILRSVMTTDTLRDFPKRKDMSASLENLAELYQLDEDGKLHMSILAWEQANRLAPEGVARARARVKSDVLLQERLRSKLLELRLLKTPQRWTPK